MCVSISIQRSSHMSIGMSVNILLEACISDLCQFLNTHPVARQQIVTTVYARTAATSNPDKSSQIPYLCVHACAYTPANKPYTCATAIVCALGLVSNAQMCM